MSKEIVIGSRGSDLALWQAHYIQDELAKQNVKARIEVIKTQGDKIQNLSFDKLEGKGFFTKEIEDKLLDKTIDLAVHSYKDLETTPPAGLAIGAVSYREDPSEIIIIKKQSFDNNQKFRFKENAIVGTSSSRRKTQLLSFRPDITINDLRGNVPTRIQKLRDGNYDAIILAKAGVNRLEIDLSEFETITLNPNEFIPAPAQGILGLQIREDDSETAEIVNLLNDAQTFAVSSLERKILNLFNGGCQLPLGVYCENRQGKYNLWVSLGQEENMFPKRRFFSSLNLDFDLEAIVEDLKQPITKNNKVFISRDVDGKGIFDRALKDNGYHAVGESLIKVNPIPYSTVPTCNWIFFSSRNGVKFFFDQNPELAKDVKIAVLGRGTESALNAYGKQAHFVGQSKDTKEVALEFRQVVENIGAQIVLFPQSNQSLQTVQHEVKFAAKVLDLVVYSTGEKTVSEIPDAYIYVFTSPSNVRSFFNQKQIDKISQKMLAIGTATYTSLKDEGCVNVKISEYPSEISLADTVIS
jgi:hydroxymethylbilane synthase